MTFFNIFNTKQACLARSFTIFPGGGHYFAPRALLLIAKFFASGRAFDYLKKFPGCLPREGGGGGGGVDAWN